MHEPMLHMICGKIAAGKSTLATRLGEAPDTIVIREDHWLSRLYPDEQHTLEDYLRHSGRLREAIAPHIVELLRGGWSVVLDFPANTPVSRAWMRSLFEAAGTAHRLHHLAVADDVCRARMHERNAVGGHEYVVSDEIFAVFTSLFVPPAAAEGFDVVTYRAG